MFIELVDSLRCIRPHEDSWLVAAVVEMDGRHIRTGTLGCPICGAEYPIDRGVVSFLTGPSMREAPSADPSAAPSSPVPGLDGDALAMRGAALLALAEQGGAIALGGSWAGAARGIITLTGVQVIAINPPPQVVAGEGISPVFVVGTLPFAAAALRGLALDRATRDAIPVERAVAALRPRGRILLPADTPVPGGVTELARDSHEWVGERGDAPSRPIRLELARPR